MSSGGTKINSTFNESEAIERLRHYLPSQAPLKDFVHHNTLHAFQNMKFTDALHSASKLFGYKVYLSLKEYRHLLDQKRISVKMLEKIVLEKKGKAAAGAWMKKILEGKYDASIASRVGALRSEWRNVRHLNLDALIHPLLFRLLCSYLDQGISIWKFPVVRNGFISSLKELENNGVASMFRSKRAKAIFMEGKHSIKDLLDLIVGDESLYEHYLFDQQFGHQGWSGMVSYIETHPETLLDKRNISLQEIIILELLLEIDVLDNKLGNNWLPLSKQLTHKPEDFFAEVPPAELNEVISILHEAFEWSYYDQVIAAVKIHEGEKKEITSKTFQALFCIDDREASMRRYLEEIDGHCETFSTPGFFNVEFYYKPAGGKFISKLCPPPVTPKFLIKETESGGKVTQDVTLSKRTHGFFMGWLITQTVGFGTAIKLMWNIFRPSMSPATATSLRHMDKTAKLIIEHNGQATEDGLQVGFTVDEMASRVKELLKSIGLVNDFAPIVYVAGHGASSVNNPHYAAYDCGACSGRPGSVNARVFACMANHPGVREILRGQGIDIPQRTQFLGALHDTTRDDIVFFDEEVLTCENLLLHSGYTKIFHEALNYNARERSRRFVSVNTKLPPEKIHEEIQKRSVSLFEPRPELNHATNALCIVAPRALTRDVFFDRRAFFNSYNYKIDAEGKYLLTILKAITPVCGGINLEYFFSRVDNYKLGAGTKLPHNVMGLFGVSNGIDGDLRPGLPSQMIEVHDPVRLLVIIEHFPETVLKVLRTVPEVYEWYRNEWIHLVAVNPETEAFFHFRNEVFTEYVPLTKEIEHIPDLTPIIESNEENLPVYIIK